ncbi:MAG: hypothetical protein MI922_08245, partial [Bacteroidales bacterium]|nr:hypothetical protein [Bacteroidales bacterium]
PGLDKILPYDSLCKGEGVRWLREYFDEPVDRPVKHPVMYGPAYEKIYGFGGRPSGGILMPGVGCENGCTFCITSQVFKKQYIALLPTGRDIFKACQQSEMEIGTRGFSIMDENFLKHPERAKDLLSIMEEHQKTYVFDIFSSAEVIKKMGIDTLVRLGIRMLWIGVESKYNTHDKTKGIDIKELINELQENGIIVNASTILFQDHHDEESLHEDIDFAISLDSNFLQFMNYTPFPSTKLFEEMSTQGRIKDLHYRHHHGQGELVFDHPHIKDRKSHISYLRSAFKK